MLAAFEAKMQEIDFNPGSNSALGPTIRFIIQKSESAELFAILLATLALGITFLAYGSSLPQWQHDNQLFTFWIVQALCGTAAACIAVRVVGEYLSEWPRGYQDSVVWIEALLAGQVDKSAETDVRASLSGCAVIVCTGGSPYIRCR